MIPPQESFDADRGQVVEVEDRLIEEEELVSANCGQQIQLEFMSASQDGLHFGFKENEASLSGILGGVERNVGVTKEVLGVLS
jgi:hypothetical protein